MQAYPEYKDSGVDWLGEIPAGWELTKLGSCLSPFSEKNHPDLPLLSITRELGVIIRDVENQDTNHNYIPDDLSGYKLLKQGQFGMNKMKAWQGSYGVSPFTGIVSPAYFMFDFTKEIDPEFFHVAIRSKLYVSFFGSASDGVRIGQWDLSKPRMKEIPLALPPLPEQTAIAEFLDDKTAKIDELVGIKRRQIELLAERKQILIQNAVTKGLNPATPMKDSGIDWIGKIPAHWEVKKSFYYFDTMKGWNAATLTKEFCGKNQGEYPVYSGQTDKGGMLGKIGTFEFDYTEGGCLLCSTVGAKAMTLRFLKEKFSLSQNCMIIVGRSERTFMKFFNYAYQPIFSYFRNLIPDHMQASFRMEDFQNMKFLLPPRNEQENICDYIDKQSKIIDATITIKQNQITKLNEYKTTLINAAVTGKIKVV